MQYISIGNKDLQPGYETFLLKENREGVSFYAYKGETALNADEKGQARNASLNGYFLRKGFSGALRDADPNVVEPVYKTRDGKSFAPRSVDEAISLIYKNELTVSGFKFKENISEKQRHEEFGKLIDSFVLASKNADFSSDKNLFCVQNGSEEVAYNNGGSKDVMIDSVDIQEKLGLKTTGVIARQIRTANALYAHYEELMKENLDEAVEALIHNNTQKVFDLQQEASRDTRFKDSEPLYTVALCEKVQKEYDGYDPERNVYSQRFPIPRSLKDLGEKMRDMSDEEKSLIPESVWNRLGNVIINETLNDYYTSPDHDGLIDRNTMRLNYGVKDLLPDVAKYGSYKDPELLNATLLVARAYDDESQFVEGQDSECKLQAAKGYIKSVKRLREEAQKKQDIQKRIEYLKNKGKSGVVIADKIAEGIQSGVIVDTVTPEKGNKMAENIRRKLSQKSR